MLCQILKSGEAGGAGRVGVGDGTVGVGDAGRVGVGDGTVGVGDAGRVGVGDGTGNGKGTGCKGILTSPPSPMG